MIKAAIYDLDDLMVNSEPAHTKAWDKLLERYNYKLSDIPEEILSTFIGRRVGDITQTIVDFFKLEVNPEEFYKERIKIFLSLAAEKLEAMPGLIESLRLFKENNFKIALASSGVKEYINLTLDKFKIKSYFDVVITGDDVKIGKPHPETYRVAVQKLGLKPEQCVVLEDAENGIASAKAAGCKCIAIINNYTPPQNRSEADLILNSLLEITLNTIKTL